MSRTTINSVSRLASLLFVVLLLLPVSAFAQFHNFFGQQQHHQQQQQQQQQQPGVNRGWQAQKDIPCGKYLCPTTFACVDFPSHCPCPYPEDRKCFLPIAPGENRDDAAYVCHRGPGCEEVKKRAAGKW